MVRVALRLLFAIVMMATAVGPVREASAFLTDVYGPETQVGSLGLVHLQGNVERRILNAIGADEYRNVDYVISQVHGAWPNKKQTDKWATYRSVTMERDAYEDGSHVKQIAKSVDLIEGYAYLKIEKPVSELEQLTLTAADVMRLTLEDPARFLPAVLQQLRREVRMTDGEFRRLSDHLFESVPRAALSPWTPLVLGCEEPSEPAPWVAGATEAWQRYVRLETSELIREILAGPPDSLEPLAESQVTEVLLLKAASTGVSDFLSLLHLPFILSHRTIGGARGTEVVVYTHNTSPTTADVYYFYLFSKTPNKKVELAAYYLDGGTEKMVGEPFRLEMCQYARVPLELMMYGGEQRWFLTGQNDVEINQINTGLPGNLLDMLNKAYRDACIAGIDPSDVDCNGVNLACLTNEDSSR